MDNHYLNLMFYVILEYFNYYKKSVPFEHPPKPFRAVWSSPAH